jgi:hypothetical protein
MSKKEKYCVVTFKDGYAEAPIWYSNLKKARKDKRARDKGKDEDAETFILELVK